jgi:hypothetical protein
VPHKIVSHKLHCRYIVLVAEEEEEEEALAADMLPWAEIQHSIIFILDPSPLPPSPLLSSTLPPPPPGGTHWRQWT